MRPNGQALLGPRGIFETKPHCKAFPGGRQVQGKPRVWSVAVWVNQTGKRSGTNPANGRSWFESKHPRAGYHHMTICVEDLGRAVFRQCLQHSVYTIISL